jgi:hypothetical protein
LVLSYSARIMLLNYGAKVKCFPEILIPSSCHGNTSWIARLSMVLISMLIMRPTAILISVARMVVMEFKLQG